DNLNFLAGANEVERDSQGFETFITRHGRFAALADSGNKISQFGGQWFVALDTDAQNVAFVHAAQHAQRIPLAGGGFVLVEEQFLRKQIAGEHAPRAGDGQHSHLLGCNPVDIQHADCPGLEAHDAIEHIFTIRIDGFERFAIQPDDRLVDQVTHQIDIVRCQVNDHPGIPDAHRIRAEALRMDVVDTSGHAFAQTAAQFGNSGVKPLDVPDSQDDPFALRLFDQRPGFFESRGNRLFDEQIDAAFDQIEANLVMLVGGHSQRHQIRLAFFDHAQVVSKVGYPVDTTDTLCRLHILVADSN